MVSLDLIARQIVMAAYLYYRLDDPVLSDGDFDKLCQTAADRWDELDKFRQWQLGSAEAIRASGYQVRVTRLAEAGAWAWFKKVKGRDPRSSVGRIWRWRHSKRHRVDWNYPA
jgi:hypothetical protein